MSNSTNHLDRYPLTEILNDIRADLGAYQSFASQYSPTRQSWIKVMSDLLMPSMAACLLYRCSHFLNCHQLPMLAMIIARLNHLLTGVSITPCSVIGGGLYIPHPGTGIVFQGTAGKSLKLFAGTAVCAGMTPLIRTRNTQTPVIGDEVSLGAKTLVIGKITVGNKVLAGFNCIIQEDIPDNTLLVSGHVRNQTEKTDHPAPPTLQY